MISGSFVFSQVLDRKNRFVLYAATYQKGVKLEGHFFSILLPTGQISTSLRIAAFFFFPFLTSDLIHPENPQFDLVISAVVVFMVYGYTLAMTLLGI